MTSENDLFSITIDHTKCTGCRICELSCSLSNTDEFNSLLSRVRILRHVDDGRIFNAPALCLNCTDPPCEKNCPTGATYRDHETNLITVDADLCIGCRGCVFACPFGACHIDPYSGKAFRCNQCDGNPVCVKMCPENVLSYVNQNQMNIVQKRKKSFMLAISSPPESI